MKKYHIIEPEVIVGLGDKTEYLEEDPFFSKIIKLHIQLEDWLGDDLMVNSNCYIITETLKILLEKSQLTGFYFEDILITKNEYFENNYQQNKSLPKFYWMKINGVKGNDDLYLDALNLYCSDLFLNFIKENAQCKYLDIDPKHDKEKDDFIMSLINRDKGGKNLMTY